jgi:hypothetical protein
LLKENNYCIAISDKLDEIQQDWLHIQTVVYSIFHGSLNSPSEQQSATLLLRYFCELNSSDFETLKKTMQQKIPRLISTISITTPSNQTMGGGIDSRSPKLHAETTWEGHENLRIFQDVIGEVREELRLLQGDNALRGGGGGGGMTTSQPVATAFLASQLMQLSQACYTSALVVCADADIVIPLESSWDTVNSGTVGAEVSSVLRAETKPEGGLESELDTETHHPEQSQETGVSERLEGKVEVEANRQSPREKRSMEVERALGRMRLVLSRLQENRSSLYAPYTSSYYQEDSPKAMTATERDRDHHGDDAPPLQQKSHPEEELEEHLYLNKNKVKDNINNNNKEQMQMQVGSGGGDGERETEMLYWCPYQEESARLADTTFLHSIEQLQASSASPPDLNESDEKRKSLLAFVRACMRNPTHPLGQSVHSAQQQCLALCSWPTQRVVDEVEAHNTLKSVQQDLKRWRHVFMRAFSLSYPLLARYSALNDVVELSMDGSFLPGLSSHLFPWYLAANAVSCQKFSTNSQALLSHSVTPLHFGWVTFIPPDEVIGEEQLHQRLEQPQIDNILTAVCDWCLCTFGGIIHQLQAAIGLVGTEGAVPTRCVDDCVAALHAINKAIPSHEHGLSADELMPLLCWVILSAQIADFPARLQCLVDCVPPCVVAGELGYALASLACAVQAVERLSLEEAAKTAQENVSALIQQCRPEEGEQADRGAITLRRDALVVIDNATDGDEELPSVGHRNRWHRQLCKYFEHAEGEGVMDRFSCSAPLRGFLYITERHLYFHLANYVPNLTGRKKGLIEIPLREIVEVSKARSWIFLSDSIMVKLKSGREYAFNSFFSRDKALQMMHATLSKCHR